MYNLVESFGNMVCCYSVTAATAKLLQSCPTLRPHRPRPTRLPRPWDSPGKNTGVGCHFLLQCMKVKNESEVLSRVRLLATPWTAAHKVPPSMGFSRQEDWSGSPVPSLYSVTKSHQLIATPWTAADLASLSSTISQSLLTFMSIESAMLSNHLILCHPLILLPLILPSIRVFSNEPALRIKAPNIRSISPSDEYSRLIYFRIGWFDLLAVQETLKSLFQHHSLKESVLWCSPFSTVQLSHLHMTPGKTIALTIWTFVSKGIAIVLIYCLDLS